ncbi:MAG: histidine phosphatase family protein [Actinomycetia bacterium]|nr:histidine phosphatase family protein [Actinomycetes bacterium]
MELILVRHARPEQIEDAEGPANPPLTDIGHRQARAVASWLAGEHFDALYVSPMARALQTAEPLARLAGMEAKVAHGVREYDADHVSYVPVEVIRQDKERWRAFLESEENLDRSHFISEVTSTLEGIIEAHRGQRVVVFCHGGVINAWAAETLGIGPRLFFDPDYTSINRFMAASSGERSIVSLNETAHLRGAADLRLYR